MKHRLSVLSSTGTVRAVRAAAALTVTTAFAMTVAGCGGKTSLQGEEGSYCSAEMPCNSGLSCVSSICLGDGLSEEDTAVVERDSQLAGEDTQVWPEYDSSSPWDSSIYPPPYETGIEWDSSIYPPPLETGIEWDTSFWFDDTGTYDTRIDTGSGDTGVRFDTGDSGPRFDTGYVDSMVRDSAVVDSTVRDSAVVDSMVRDSAVVDSTVRDSAPVDSMVRDSALVDSSAIDTASTLDTSALRDTAVTDTYIPWDAPQCIPELIDDFARADGRIANLCGRNGAWSWGNDGTGTQTVVRVAITDPPFPYYDAIYTYGDSMMWWGAGIGTPLVVDTRGAPQRYDLTYGGKFTGVRFRAKVNAGTSTQVTFKISDLHTQPAGGFCVDRCYDHPAQTRTVTTNWQWYYVRFAEMKQQGWGYPLYGALDPTQAYTLEFFLPPQQAFAFYIDRIELF